MGLGQGGGSDVALTWRGSSCCFSVSTPSVVVIGALRALTPDLRVGNKLDDPFAKSKRILAESIALCTFAADRQNP